MKLALGPLGLTLVGAAAMAFVAGCGSSSAHRAAEPRVGTTELSSVTFTLSRLAPASWEEGEPIARAATPAQTWGAASAPAPTPSPELMSTP